MRKILLFLVFVFSVCGQMVWTASTPDISGTLDSSGRLTLTGVKTGKVISTDFRPTAPPTISADNLEVNFSNNQPLAQSVSIQINPNDPVVVLSATYLSGGPNNDSFFSFSEWPKQDHQFDFQYWDYEFKCATPQSPCVLFDDQANTTIISPANHFIAAQTVLSGDGNLQARVDPQITNLSAGYTHKIIIVFGQGINSTFEKWGNFLTHALGVERATNTPEILHQSLSYWTDALSTYYYTPIAEFKSALDPTGYKGTLLAISDYFRNTVNIQLSSMQLDSWWYPKGQSRVWSDTSVGIYEYRHSRDIFPDARTTSTSLINGDGLKQFQRSLALPLVVHSRWIDLDSKNPYRQQGIVSGNVVIDKTWWDNTASYLHSNKVKVFEQDWLADKAHADPSNLEDSEAFFDNMAQAMAAKQINVQYCMPLPSHILQSAKYSNVTTLRLYQDGFGQKTPFLFNSRLAWSLGKRGFTDNIRTTNLGDLILATLSGVVGLGDAIGSVNIDNLNHSAMPDGTLVTPDSPPLPLDSVYIKTANGQRTPITAASFVNHASLKNAYVYVYEADAVAQEPLNLTETGMSGQVYVYNRSLDKNHTSVGTLTDAAIPYLLQNPGSDNFLQIAPVVNIESIQLALLGDLGKFVSLGKQRVPREWFDGSALRATVVFAKNEKSVTLTGFASSQPHALVNGLPVTVTYDPTTQLFSLAVTPARLGPAQVKIFP